MLEEDVTIEEITRAMLSMQNNKAPGLDGLPKEYYFTFWEQLSSSLLLVYKESWDKKVLPLSMNEEMISLLWKKGSKKDLRNWRPLTLLGVDIKILTKALFFRLQAVVPKLIGVEQTCGILGRKMTDSLAIIRDSYFYSQEQNIPLCVLGIDLEKAFDNVNHMFLMKVLEILGFGEGFRRWIHVLYSSCSSVVVVNGMFTDPVAIKSGVRQGCPLSPILFILVMESLACALRLDNSITGLIPLGSGGKKIKFTMYVDDTTLVLTDNMSIDRSLLVCETFVAASGMKINKSKSKVIYFNWRETKENWGLTEKFETIKILGVEIGMDMQFKNWNMKLSKIQGKLLGWKDRELSFVGKVLVLKAEVIVSLACLATILPIPYTMLASLRKAMFRFLWGSQHERLKRDIMYRPIKMGGRAVPEIASKLNAMFITPVLKACFSDFNDLIWPYFTRFWIGQRVLKARGRRCPLSTPLSEQYSVVYDIVIKSLKCFSSQIMPQAITRTNIEELLFPTDRM